MGPNSKSPEMSCGFEAPAIFHSADSSVETEGLLPALDLLPTGFNLTLVHEEGTASVDLLLLLMLLRDFSFT